MPWRGCFVSLSVLHAPVAVRRPSFVGELSKIAAEVQRQRSIRAVLDTAGRGVQRLGMRFYAFQVREQDLVLHSIATSPARQDAIERRIGRPLTGLRAPASDLAHVREVVGQRRIVHRPDLDLLHDLVRRATGFDPATLDVTPETAGIDNGVLAPIFVRDVPWGLLGVVSRSLTKDDADAVALFATHVGSALEVAETIETLEQTNRELARAQQGLVDRERLAALGELAAVVAHEVRNPLCVVFNALAGIRGFLRTGAPAERHDEASALAALAEEEAIRLNRIVSDLLDFARPKTPELRTGSVVPVLDSVVAAAPDHRLRVDIDHDLPLVEVDALFMRQAVLNLVLNALQAIGQRGTITLRARVEGPESPYAVRVEVIDDGPGIPSTVQDRMFTPFFTTKPSGTGLGLAVVKRIVDDHRGALVVESSPRRTSFAIKLPPARAEAATR